MIQIPFNNSFFSKLIVDYVSQNINIKPLYNHYPNLKNFEKQITYQKTQLKDRKTLVKVLNEQYQNFKISAATKKNIELLKNENTFTITTGHQLNLFTGSLYFIYKIVETIQICTQLKKQYPTYNFIPIYWLANEDHDFEEINHFSFENYTLKWNTDQKGKVGKFSTENLNIIYKKLKKILPQNKNCQKILQLFYDSYLQNKNLTTATKFLINQIFNEYGLVILDADHKKLKQKFIPYIKDEILQQKNYNLIQQTNDFLTTKNYKVQVNQREINLFYTNKNLRERIVLENGVYKILNTNISFTKNEIIDLIEKEPEKFSPNVIFRPLYQEVILPNLCYVGGGSEISYWLQLKTMFKYNNIKMPILKVRKSFVYITDKQQKKMKKHHISFKELCLPLYQLLSKKIVENSFLFSQLEIHQTQLNKMFLELENIATKTDFSFTGAVKAQHKKQLNGLKKLNQKLIKAEKKKHALKINEITTLHQSLFPNGKLQERQKNFFELFLQDKNFIETLLKINLIL